MAVVRFTTSGQLRRIDVSPVVDLLPALREEWAGLQFDRDGSLVNPLTLTPVRSVSLLDGRHRHVGARYRVTVTVPKLDLPDDRRAEFEKESQKLSRRNAKQDAWDEHFARRREASVQVGTDERLLTATLREDNSRTLALTLTDEHEHWTVAVDIEHGRLPSVSIRGTLDLAALLEAQGTPGCLAGILGGTGEGTGIVDLATLERDGRVIYAQGHANRFRVSLHLEVRTSATQWMLDGRGVLRARGLARPILWFAGRRIRRSMDHSLAEFWSTSESRMREVDLEMHRLRSAIEEEGGQASFVRRMLWDEDFDPGLALLRSGRA